MIAAEVPSTWTVAIVGLGGTIVTTFGVVLAARYRSRPLPPAHDEQVFELARDVGGLKVAVDVLDRRVERLETR